jgi:hypothetical protein
MLMRFKKACVMWAILPTLLNQALGANQVELLKIRVVEGEGAFNDTKKGTAQNPVVVIQNQDDEPVPGAQVTFTLPHIGQGGVFGRNEKTFSTTTDQAGRAGTFGLRPNSIEGSFDIRVQASYGGASASTLIPQSNTSAISSGGGSRKLLVLGVVGAIAGGVLGVVLSRGGGASSVPVPPANPTGITGGTISVGGPR